MANITITDVRTIPGDSGFLIDDGKTAILYDSGFGFTGDALTENIQKALGDRKLDYIFLTHSHYDHVLGSVCVAKAYPNAKIIAAGYAEEVFHRPSALAVMDALDRKVADLHGVGSYTPCAAKLKVDIPAKDGDIITCGDLRFDVVGLPGHTQCSLGFYLEEHKLFLGTETLGVYFGENTYLPSCLVGYQMTLDAYDKANKLDIDRMLLPHYGVVGTEEAQTYLAKAKRVTRETAECIRTHLLAGRSNDWILTHLEEKQYTANVAPIYPIQAYRMNTSLMIERIRKEFRL